MSHGSGLVLKGGRVVALARPAFLALALAASCASTRAAVRDDDDNGGANMSDAAAQWLVVQLRSFVPGAAGRLVVEPSAAGGTVRLRATRLPAPSTVTPGARAFVVWATGGEVRRLGELRRDARGNAAIEFAHPAGFATYSLLVTAETGAQPERPAGAFVFSTRAGEVSALYPVRREEARTIPLTPAPRAAVRERTVTVAPKAAPAPKPTPATPSVKTAPPLKSAATPVRPAPSVVRAPAVVRPPMTARAASPAPASSVAEFYESINSAVEDPAAARTLTLEGEGAARRAGGDARVATRGGTAYVRVRFRSVPPPSRYGVRKYVMWAETQDEGALFLRALPASRLNRRTVYARRPNFGSDDFRLAVTAERTYPRPRPRGRRVMKTVTR